jgi:hypothetical protein
MINDPRNAKTVEEACINEDGKTFNAFKLLSFLSEALNPGSGISEQEVKAEFEKIKQKKATTQAK